MDAKKYTYDTYDVYIIKTDKFKTNKLYTILFNDYKKENLTKAKLLSEILCRSNANFKNEIEVSKEVMNLYNPALSIVNSYLNLHELAFKLTFLDEKYTEKGMNDKTIKAYYDVIFNPNVIDNKFEQKNFALAKNRLDSIYKREKENPHAYAFKKSFELISEDLPCKNVSYGYAKDLEKINEENLYDYYKEIISSSKASIFAIGSFDDDELLKSINSCVQGHFSEKEYKIEPYTLEKKSNFPIENIEEEDYNQSDLIMIYKLLNMTKRERECVLPILNKIIGAPFSSKLFINVREKNSLAYSIYSSYYSFSSLLYIEAGISAEDFDKVVSLIKDQIKEIQTGNIIDKEISIAKESTIINLRKNKDSSAGQVGLIIDEVLCNIKYSEEDYNSVTKEEIVSLSNKLNLDVVYFLKGVNE